MSVREVNFDGLIGPTHNYAGLSPGNIAAETHAGSTAHPRAAALQGLDKMRRLLSLGLVQGFLPPPSRPATAPLRALGFSGDDDQVLARAASEEPEVFRAVCSASSMWAANAATVIAAPDSGDGRTHLITANLSRMMHRSFEADDTFATLSTVFKDPAHFVVHRALPQAQHFGDEGAANHMRLARDHGAPGLNIFVHGPGQAGRYPERQAARAGRAVARLAGLAAERTMFVSQASAAIEAGAFHNDVVAVANERLLLVHAQAFEDQASVLEALRARAPGLIVHEVADLSLQTAVSTYLFNSQLVTLPDGDMAVVAPRETADDPDAARALAALLAGDNPVREAVIVDVRESMRNGGGPACLRLRVPLSPAALAAVDGRFLLDEPRVETLSRVVERCWPATLAPADLADPALWETCRAAHRALWTTIQGFAA